MKIKTILGVMILLFSMCVAEGWAQQNSSTATNTKPQNVSNLAQEQFGASFGTDTNGSNVSGWSGAESSANDDKHASASDAALGTGTSKQATPSGAVSSAADSTVSSVAKAKGQGADEVGVAGGAAQSNWALTGGDDTNNAGGYNTTAASYDGTMDDSGPQKAYGTADASGSTLASSTFGPNAAASQVTTTGSSHADMSIPGSMYATGYGIIGAASTIGTPDSGPFAVGTIQSTANYAGSSGSLLISGQTSALVNANTVKATATVKSVANGSGNGNPPQCGCQQ